MDQYPPERRSFASPEDEAEEASRTLHEQIARLRAQVREAKARLAPTARERALGEESDEGPST